MTKNCENDKSRLREQDIRPSEVMAGQRAALLTDVGRLLSRRREFVSVSCPACDSASAVHKYEKRGFDYVECSACATMYVNPRPAPDVLQAFYRESENYAYWNDVIYPSSESSRRDRIIVPRVEQVLQICRRYHIAAESLMEVGAGFGTFCIELLSRRSFRRIVAVEPTPGLAATCRNKGLETFEQPIETLSSDATGLFDVIVCFEVIEHLFSPRLFVTHMRRFLRPGGVLILSCPNAQGFDVQLLGPLSTTVDHEHLNYFTPRSLSLLLGSCGFTVLESFTPGKLDAELVRNQIIDGNLDISHQPFLQRVLVDEWERLGAAFQEFLAQQGMSSNMWVVAQNGPGSSGE